MSDAVKLTPALPTVPPLPPVPEARPDLRVEPAEKLRPEPRTANNGNGRDRQAPEATQRSLSISRNEQLGAVVYRSIDDESGEVVWQYPADSALRMAEQLQELQAQRERAAERRVDEKA